MDGGRRGPMTRAGPYIRWGIHGEGSGPRPRRLALWMGMGAASPRLRRRKLEQKVRKRKKTAGKTILDLRREPLERLTATRNAKKESPAMDRKRVRKTPEWKRKRLL